MKAQKDDLIVHTLSVSCGSSYHISGVIYTVPVTFVLDTGAAVSLIREDVWTRITKTAGVSLPELREWRGKRLHGWRQWFSIVCAGIREIPGVPGRQTPTGGSDTNNIQ